MSTMTSLWGTQKPAKGKRFGILCDAHKELMCIFLKYWQFSSQKCFLSVTFVKVMQAVSLWIRSHYWHKRDWRVVCGKTVFELWPILASLLATPTEIPFALCHSPWTGSKLVVPNCSQDRARQTHTCFSQDSWGHILRPTETRPGPQLPQGNVLLS